MGEGEKERAVVVTTKDRGVFFGYITGNTSRSKINLKRARNCLYWPAACRGFMGLASDGPKEGAKVGPPANIELFGITAVVDCTKEATAQWELGLWGS